MDQIYSKDIPVNSLNFPAQPLFYSPPSVIDKLPKCTSVLLLNDSVFPSPGFLCFVLQRQIPHAPLSRFHIILNIVDYFDLLFVLLLTTQDFKTSKLHRREWEAKNE